jgi:hypothetical protein
MGVGVAEHPAGSVDEQHYRQRATRPDRFDDADRDVTVRSTWDGHVGDVRLGLADRARLQFIEGDPAPLRAKLEQIGLEAGGLGERPSGRLEQNGSTESR